MPTKRPRHAITETPPVKEALDELREELDGERVDFGELVVLGARERLAQLRASEDRKVQLRRQLADRIRDREMIPLDLEAAEYVKRHGWADRDPSP